MKDLRQRLLQARTCFVWLLVLRVAGREAVGEASPFSITPQNGGAKGQLIQTGIQVEGVPSADDEDLPNNVPMHDTTASAFTNKVTKRSAYDYDDVQPSSSYYSNMGDPGYESYMQSIQYDPMMSWGKRKRNHDDASNYADYMAHHSRLARDPQDNYMESVYHPYNFFHAFKRALSSRYPALYRQSKRSIDRGSSGIHDGSLSHDSTPGIRKKRNADKNEEQDTDTRPRATGNENLESPYNVGLLRSIDNLWRLNKRRFGMDASGFHGDTFNDGWGTFSTMKKRRPEWDSSGFHGDIFSGGFGRFDTMKKRRPEMDASGFYGDAFNGGFGDFYTMKRRPEMTSSGFYGDTFSNGFGDFYTMKKRSLNADKLTPAMRPKREVAKRRPEMTSSGFHGDTFSNGFGDFYTMKRNQKRRPEMTSSGFYGDTFSNGFGDFYTMKREQQKRRPEMTSSGFHGDTFSNGFGDFYTMKRNEKRRPEMTSSGFHGDTFSGGFGDFYTMKRNLQNQSPQPSVLEPSSPSSNSPSFSGTSDKSTNDAHNEIRNKQLKQEDMTR